MPVDIVEFISGRAGGGVGEIDFGCAVAVDTPAHAEGGELPDLVHFLDGAMAGLALDLADADVLGVAEEDMIREVMDFYPFDGPAGPRVLSFCRIVTGITK